MVEALSTKFQNLYNKYTKSEISENASQDNRRELYIVPVDTISANDEQIVQRNRPKPHGTFVFNFKHLCQPKDTQWQIIKHRRTRPFTGQCCSVCIPVRY